MIGVASVTTLTKNKILEEIKDKESRDIFVAEHVSTGLPFQIHALREKLGITQAELARRAKMAQERISVLENPNSEFIPKINTLLKLANVFDVPVIVKFGTWEELFEWETNLSPELLAPENFDEALESLECLASGSTATQRLRVGSASTIERGWVIDRSTKAVDTYTPVGTFRDKLKFSLKNKIEEKAMRAWYGGRTSTDYKGESEEEQLPESDATLDLFTSDVIRNFVIHNEAVNTLIPLDLVM